MTSSNPDLQRLYEKCSALLEEYKSKVTKLEHKEKKLNAENQLLKNKIKKFESVVY